MQVQVLSLSGICFAIMPEDLSFAEVFDNFCLSFLVSKVQRLATNTKQIMCLFRKSKFLQIILWLIALATNANVSVLQVCPRIRDLSSTKF